MTKIIFE